MNVPMWVAEWAGLGLVAVLIVTAGAVWGTLLLTGRKR